MNPPLSPTDFANQFVQDFPEFSNPAQFPVSQMNFWYSIALETLRPQAWRRLYMQGLELFVAHHISINATNVKTAAVGGVPGATTGTVASKAVDKVSVSYDGSGVIEAGAGHWNLTTYGLQFIHLARMMGAGGIQVTGGTAPYPTYPVWSRQ